jgi:hypothetical protein
MRARAWLVAVGLVVVLPLLASGVDIDAAGLFAQLDANRDGRVVAAEAGEAHAALFARLVRTGDENGDGALTAEELATALTPVRADKAAVEKQGSRLPGSDALVVLVAKMDANRDRQLDADEIPAAYRGAFDAMLARGDADKNGRLDGRELADGGVQLGMIAQNAAARLRLDVPAELAKLPPERRQAIERMGAFPNPREMLADPTQIGALVAQFDANGDKQLAADEVPEGLANIIRRADQNGDGQASAAELTAVSRRMSARDNGNPLQRRPPRPNPPRTGRPRQ